MHVFRSSGCAMGLGECVYEKEGRSDPTMVGIIDCCVYVLCAIGMLLLIGLSILGSGYVFKMLEYMGKKHYEIDPVSLVSMIESNLEYDATLSITITGVWVVGLMLFICICYLVVLAIRMQLAWCCGKVLKCVCCSYLFDEDDHKLYTQYEMENMTGMSERRHRSSQRKKGSKKYYDSDEEESSV